MARKRKSVEEFHFAHGRDRCWLCEFLGIQTTAEMELHHIAGRGRQHEVRANYAALCQRCHEVIQSRKDSELVCLVLKRQFDSEHYDPALICELRARATTWITEADVDLCERIMDMMREVR